MLIHSSVHMLNFMLPECRPNFACATQKVERAYLKEYFENTASIKIRNT